MKFEKIIKKLQEENEGYVILIRCGIFFVAIGKDAVFMQQQYGLSTLCFKEGICKNGIVLKSMEKFIPKFKESGYSYKIYNYEKETGNIKEILRIDGKLLEETVENMGCSKCQYNDYENKKIRNSLEYLDNVAKGRIIL